MEAVYTQNKGRILRLQNGQQNSLKLVRKHLTISTSQQVYAIPIQEITYIRAYSNYSTVYLENGSKILTSKTLKYHADRLPVAKFIRTHQSYLVNKAYIKSIIRSDQLLHLKNNIQIPISRSKKSLINQLFKNQ
jgi:two-component system LytT family response regulator